MKWAIGGLVVGIIIGYLAPVAVPVAYAKLFLVALLAGLDAVFGGLRAATQNKFDNVVFITGFFINGLLAAFLVFVGDKLGLDLYYVALLALGFRIFKNMALLRRYLVSKHDAPHEMHTGAPHDGL